MSGWDAQSHRFSFSSSFPPSPTLPPLPSLPPFFLPSSRPCALTREWTCNLGIYRQLSNQLSYLPRAQRQFHWNGQKNETKKYYVSLVSLKTCSIVFSCCRITSKPWLLISFSTSWRRSVDGYPLRKRARVILSWFYSKLTSSLQNTGKYSK